MLDLSREPLLRPQPPQGYFAPGGDPLEQALAARELAALVGEFEKPRFFPTSERICAHSRSGIVGCNKCLDVCSTGAIQRLAIVSGRAAPVHGLRRLRDRVPVGRDDLRLSARGRARPAAEDPAGRVPRCGRRDACVALPQARPTAQLLARLAARGEGGLPAHVIPLEVLPRRLARPRPAAGGARLGARQVAILSTAEAHPTTWRDRAADGARADDRLGARLPGRALLG